MSKMKRLIECYVPIYACNMRCDYCYIKQNDNRHFEKSISAFKYSPKYMAKCLSKKRLGGTCLINLCAGGETLLSHEVVELAIELLKEGHYVMIVNNGTITKHIKQLCEIDEEYKKRLWFRFSLHWLELKRLNKIDCFFDNVNLAKQSGCSIALEMVASDDYIPHIEEIKATCLDRIKSLPEISIARREKDFAVLTDLKKEDYDKIWGQFNSQSFNFKNNTVGVKRKEFCYAGDWTVTLDLKDGAMSKCYSAPVQNIFKNPNEKIRFEAIGKHCHLPYCHNSHIFMTAGDIPKLDFPTFAQIRDKECTDGSRWLTKEMREFIDCKLWETNKEYSSCKKCRLSIKIARRKFGEKIKTILRKIKRLFKADSRKVKYAKNIIFSVGSKVLMFALGLIIPRLIMLNYGSNANGLLGSVGNIFTYIALIEAGIGTAAVQALYKPIAQKNREEVSSVLVATQNYFRRLLIWYAGAVLIFSCVYPLISSEYSYFVVFGVISVQGLSHVLTYYFASTITQLLAADGREYVSQIVALLVFVLNSVIKIILLWLGVNLVVVQCSYLVVNVIQIIIYKLYINHHYKWINWKAIPADNALAKRNRYMLNGVAWTVFNSTDTLLLSMICGFAISSVYTIYNLIYANLNMILAILYSGAYFLLGQTYHEDKKRYLLLHDGMESIISGIMFAIISTAYMLTLPFIALYTRGINDVVYVDKYLPLLFCLVQIFSNARLFSGNLINVCNQPQLTNKASIIEVVINITLSIGLAFWIGIYGVLIATVVALFYKTNLIIVRSNKILLGRSPWKTYKIFCTNFLMFMGVVVLTYFFPLNISSYIQLLIYAMIIGIACLLVYILVNILINPEVLKIIKLYFRRRSK